jgi:integrase/recombinase XerD
MKTYLEVSEIKSLEDAATNLRDKLLIRLLFHLGCPISEALAITTEDLDLKENTILIQHLKTRLKLGCPDCGTNLGRSHYYCPKCGVKVAQAVAESKEHRRMRTLPVDNKTLEILKEYISRGAPVTRRDKTLIFGSNRHRDWQIIRECADKAGLPKLINPESGRCHNVSLHRLRDAFAVHAVKLDDSGDGLRMLQEHLGHTSFTTTARYRKVSGEEHRDWYHKLWFGDEPPVKNKGQ